MELQLALDVAAKFTAELASRQVIDIFGNMARSLQTAVSQPNPQNDQAFSGNLKNLFAILDAAPSNQWTPTQRRILQRLRLSDFTGLGLRAALEKVLSENAMTRSLAAQRVNELSTQLQNQSTTANQLVNSLKALGLEPRTEGSADGSEVVVVIPTPENHHTLEILDDDLGRFNRLFKVLSEISGEGAASPRVTGLSTGSWIISVDQALRAAEHLIRMIAEIVGTIKGVAILRKKIRNIAEEPDTEPETLAALEKQIEARLESRLTKLAKEMAQSAEVDQGRRNQLESEMEINVRFLARKLDRGVRIEISLPDTLPAATQHNKSAEEISQMQASLARAKEQALSIAKLEDLNEPVLSLPDPEESPSAANASEPE